MGDSNKRRTDVHRGTGRNGIPDSVWQTGSHSAAYYVYANGRTGHDVSLGSHHRKPGDSARLPTWYHWARVIAAIGFVILSLIVWMVYGG